MGETDILCCLISHRAPNVAMAGWIWMVNTVENCCIERLNCADRADDLRHLKPLTPVSTNGENGVEKMGSILTN